MSALRPLHAILLLIAATAIAGPVWAVFVHEPRPYSLAETIPDRRTLVQIETMAEKACRCTRARHGKERGGPCWDEFDKTVAPYNPSVSVLGCGVTGTESLCFGKFGKRERCITVDRSPNGECNDEERRAIASIWREGDRYYDDPAEFARAVEAERRAREAFERGDRLQASADAAIGCGG